MQAVFLEPPIWLVFNMRIPNEFTKYQCNLFFSINFFSHTLPLCLSSVTSHTHTHTHTHTHIDVTPKILRDALFLWEDNICLFHRDTGTAKLKKPGLKTEMANTGPAFSSALPARHRTCRGGARAGRGPPLRTLGDGAGVEQSGFSQPECSSQHLRAVG